MAIGVRRRAFGVKGNEIKRGAELAGGEVGAAQTVLEKFASESAAAASGIGPADFRRREGAANAVNRVVM